MPSQHKILLNEIYVDNILSGSNEIQSTINSLTQVIEALNSAGLPIKKIAANYPMPTFLNLATQTQQKLWEYAETRLPLNPPQSVVPNARSYMLWRNFSTWQDGYHQL